MMEEGGGEGKGGESGEVEGEGCLAKNLGMRAECATVLRDAAQCVSRARPRQQHMEGT